MFHMLLVLLMIVITIIMMGILLLGITLMIVSFIGGTTVTLLVKNPNVKRLLLVSFGLLLGIGLFCLSPFFSFNIVTFLYIYWVSLALEGIYYSRFIENKVGRTLLYFIYGIIILVVGILWIINF